jgi:hypothetical protein
MPPDNTAQAGTTYEAQHPIPPCVAGAQNTAYRSSLTDDQASAQVSAGITYINYCRKVVDAYMGQYGYAGQPGWSDSDWSYWALVKMVHVAPATIPKLLAAGKAGGDFPADWDAMVASSSGIPPSWTANARKVGLLGQGGGSLISALTTGTNGLLMVALGGLVALALLTKRSSRHAT